MEAPVFLGGLGHDQLSGQLERYEEKAMASGVDGRSGESWKKRPGKSRKGRDKKAKSRVKGISNVVHLGSSESGRSEPKSENRDSKAISEPGASSYPLKRSGKIRRCERYEIESLLPALARQGGTAVLTQELDGTFVLEFVSGAGLRTSELRARGTWFRAKGKSDSGSGKDKKAGNFDLLIGGFEHIHPHVLVGCAYQEAGAAPDDLYMQLAIWGLDNFLNTQLRSITADMNEMTAQTEAYFGPRKTKKQRKAAELAGKRSEEPWSCEKIRFKRYDESATYCGQFDIDIDDERFKGMQNHNTGYIHVHP